MRNDQQARKAPRRRLVRGARRFPSLLSHIALFEFIILVTIQIKFTHIGPFVCAWLVMAALFQQVEGPYKRQE
jgi:hypothetical protein